VANTWMPPSYTFYNPKARAYAYNFDQARQLLSQMGWRPGADGILQRTMDGKTVRFELEFATTAGRALRERVQQFLADNLKQVGIAVKINNAPTANIVDDKYLPRGSTGAWTGGIMIAQFFAPQTLEGDLFACKNLVTGQQVVANEANGFGGANDTGWCSDEYDRLYSQVLYEFDPTKRKAAFARMQEIFAEEVPYIPLYWRTASYVTRKGLVNYVASTFSGGLGIPNWAGWNIGWESRGAQKLYDQAQYAQTPK
ncbi:MAG TPA: ABC transporter substrate-binding protein, partial [Meiothermus sp.]|nr:ABC transporter substrate-binding protein [Meiothermus sp.]